MPSQSPDHFRRNRLARGFLAVFMAGSLASAWGCSSVDPKVGPRRGETDDDLVIDGGDADGDDTVGPGEVSFRLDIRPLLERPRDDPDGKGCKGCHYRTEPNHTGVDLSGLDMSTLGALREGGGSSRARIIVRGKPKESVLVQALRGTYNASGQMPKNGPFWSAERLALVETWIAQGAKGADDE